MMTRPILLPVPNAPSDAELVVRAVEGDRFGRELIYRRHAGYLLAMITRLLASRADAEEIVRETFILGLRRMATMPESAELRGWLSRLAIGLARRRLRRARLLRFFLRFFLPFLGLARRDDEDARLAALATPTATAASATIDHGLAVRAELEHVDRVLERARPEPRIAWMLRRVEGLALADVAAACGCAPATAQRRIAEIDARLVDRLGTPAESA
jgi:RNA polymerase sigma-70 factor (ECF subfamily)